MVSLHGTRPKAILAEIERLRARLAEAEDTLRAIRSGEVDALVVEGAQGPQVFTLRGAERPYRVLVEEMSEGAVTLSEQGIICYCNRRFAELVRAPMDRIMGEAFSSFVAPAEVPAFGAMLQTALTEPCGGDITGRAVDGSPVPLHVSLKRLPLAAPAAVAVVVTDLTERRAKENELRERTTRLEAAMKELEGFSYSVSHDLRAPLRAIDGYGHILLEDYAERLDAEGRRILGVISAETRRMGALIDDLLTFSRLGREQLAAADIDMTALVNDVLRELVPHDDTRTVEVHIEPLPPAHGDRAMLRVALINLIANAIKFSAPRNPRRIEIGGHRQSAETVYYVKDNGVGFDMHYADKLFGVFQRLHAGGEFAGTGVGLALVQRIIHRHGGRIWAEARENEGATFSFAIPDPGHGA